MLKTWFHFYASLKPKGELCLRASFYFLMSLKLEINYAQGNVLHFLTSLTRNGNYAHRHGLTQHGIQRLVTRTMPPILPMMGRS